MRSCQLMAPGTNPGYERAYRIWGGTLPMNFAEGQRRHKLVRCLHATSSHALCSSVTYARFARPEHRWQRARRVPVFLRAKDNNAYYYCLNPGEAPPPKSS